MEIKATTAEEKLEAIKKIFEVKKQIEERTFVSTHAADNLMGAILTITEKNEVDVTSLRTLNRVYDQLRQIATILELY